MESKSICQSCGMPVDNSDLGGTELNGSKSKEYCKYCYHNGVFTDPVMTIDEMKSLVKIQMMKMDMPQTTVDMVINGLPLLKRWRKTTYIL